jgi:hypothetical protein
MPARLYLDVVVPRSWGQCHDRQNRRFCVVSGERGAREIACTWAGIAWTTLLLIIKLGACLDLAGSFCNTLQISCASSLLTTLPTLRGLACSHQTVLSRNRGDQCVAIFEQQIQHDGLAGELHKHGQLQPAWRLFMNLQHKHWSMMETQMPCDATRICISSNTAAARAGLCSA